MARPPAPAALSIAARSLRALGPLALVVIVHVALSAGAAAQNLPPATPVITEPAQDGLITNPEDTHMETGPFSDPNPGNTHTCSDWEIWTVSPSERIWSALCVTGPGRVHIHLGDGAFQGSHVGRVSLLPTTNYRLRVRHRDSSGQAATQWSPYAQRLFTTGSLSSVFPMELDDIASSPAPQWLDTTGVPAALPGGASPGVLRIESGTAQNLLTITGTAGGTNQVTNPGAINEHVPVRVRITSGGQPLVLPETDLSFTDHSGADHVIYLPGLSLGAGQTASYWVSANGSTYVGQPSQTQPVFTTLARGADVPWTARTGFKVEVVASGFQLPVNIAFIPNPSPAPDAPLFYVSELYGAIKVVRRNGTVGTYASGLLNFNPTGNFPGSGEQGLAGIAVHPTTGDVYATLLYDSAPPEGDHYPKVVRFQSTNGGQTASTQTTILDMPGETQGQSHQVSSISFGPDGKLYVHMGDGFEVATAVALFSFRGKILRMNLDGTAPTDNPYYNGLPISSRDYVYARGFRNPFGGAWRAADGRLYEVENGPSVDRFARVNPGQNFLFDGSDASMHNGALYNWDPAAGPVNVAFVQPQTFGGSQFPSWMQGHAFVSESGATWGTGVQPIGKRISEFVLDANGALVEGPTPLVVYNGAGKASCVGLAAGPDGLYFTDLYRDEGYTSPIDPGANVLRVRFVGAAEFAADVKTGPAPLAVQFTDLSNVPSPSQWLWTFGDGTTSTDPNPTHVYTQDGEYTVRLRVTGPGGAAVLQKEAYVRVGLPPRAVLIGGDLPPVGADQAVADFLVSEGFEVDVHDDELHNREPAAWFADKYDLAVISSTVDPANIAGEFRTVNLPLLFWEQGLLRAPFEPLATDGTAVGNVFNVTINDNTHPITQGLSLAPYGAFQPGAWMSVGRGTVGAGALLLARRGGLATDYSVLAAEQGATLQGKYQAPARRVFTYLENTSYFSATGFTRQLLARSACWAGDLDAAVITPPQPVTVPPGGGAAFSVTVRGAAPVEYRWRRNGVPVIDGGPFSGASTRVLSINPATAAEAGSYDVVVTNMCGTVTSAAATLTVGTGCYPDCTGEGSLSIADFACFQSRFVAGDPYADCNQSGGLTVADFACFQSEFVAGCP